MRYNRFVGSCWRHFVNRRVLLGLAVPFALQVTNVKTALCDDPALEQYKLNENERIAKEAVNRAIRNLAKQKVREDLGPIIEKAIREAILEINREINREIRGLRGHIQREVQELAEKLVPRVLDQYIRKHDKEHKFRTS